MIFNRKIPRSFLVWHCALGSLKEIAATQVILMDNRIIGFGSYGASGMIVIRLASYIYICIHVISDVLTELSIFLLTRTSPWDIHSLESDTPFHIFFFFFFSMSSLSPQKTKKKDNTISTQQTCQCKKKNKAQTYR